MPTLPDLRRQVEEVNIPPYPMEPWELENHYRHALTKLKNIIYDLIDKIEELEEVVQ